MGIQLLFSFALISYVPQTLTLVGHLVCFQTTYTTLVWFMSRGAGRVGHTETTVTCGA